MRVARFLCAAVFGMVFFMTGARADRIELPAGPNRDLVYAECRTCHDFSQMDLSAQSRSARNRHGRAPDEGKTCIDCHKGIAHEEPDEPEDVDEE